jgi:maleate cis-trans isomerase
MSDTHTRGLLVVPANNTTLEPEMNLLCPTLAPFSVARVARPARTLTAADLPAYGQSTLEAVAPFVAERPALVVYGCTAAGFLAGPAGNARMTGMLHERTGAAVVSTAAAMTAVLRDEGVAEVAVITPYLAPVNDGLRAYLHAAGIEVEVLESFLCSTTDELGRITQDQVLDLALRTVTPRSRALFIACSQLPTLAIVDRLRTRLGYPVWSSIRATAWAAGRALSMRSVREAME